MAHRRAVSTPNRAAVVRLVGAVPAERTTSGRWRGAAMVTLLSPPGREVTSGEEVLLQAAS